MTAQALAHTSFTRRMLITAGVVVLALVALLTVRLDAVAHGGPAVTPIASGSTADRIVLKTHPNDTSRVSTFRLSFDHADAATPWHRHPGPGLVTITEGVFELTVVGPTGCSTRTLRAGDAFVDGGDGAVHRLVLTSATGAAVATFVTPVGEKLSEVTPEPDC